VTSRSPTGETNTTRRAGAFAAVGALSLLAPVLAGRYPQGVVTVAVTAPFLVIAAVALYGVDDGVLFDLFAVPGDRRAGRLYGLAGFALAAAGLGLLTAQFGMPPGVFVASVLLVSIGDLGQRLAGRFDAEVVPIAGFVVVGALGGGAGFAVAGALDASTVAPALAAFLVVAGAHLAALERTILFERDDPLVMLSVGLALWPFTDLALTVPPVRLVVGLALSVGFGALAYRIDTASLTGMLTGILLALLTVVLGGYGWFAVLISFFGLGGLAAKFRYEEKLERGIAEENEGARSSGNVLANSAAAVLAVLAFAVAGRLGVDPAPFRFAFVGGVAAAMSDTFSSEFGGLYDTPRVITTLERVGPGTDGAVTWQGELAGIGGAAVVALVALPFFGLSPVGIAIVVLAGAVGMNVDSLLGATLEGRTLDNQGVNLLATLTAAVTAGVVAVPLGVG